VAGCRTTCRSQFSGDYTKDDAEPKGYQRLVANRLCPLFGITCAPNDSRWDTNSGLAPLNGTDAKGASLVVSAKLNDAWDFKSISAYRESDSKNNIDFDTTQARIVDVIGDLLRRAAHAGVPVRLRHRRQALRRPRRLLLRR
jgi:hypothetical protein